MRTVTAVSPKSLSENLFTEIGDHWMLISARKPDGSCNTMTASWGGTGILFGKPVCFVFIRPVRHTYRFTEEADTLTLSFFGGAYREALTLCGKLSGRDCDKIARSGLTPRFDLADSLFFDEASLVFRCKKLYADFLHPEAFVQRELIPTVYPEADFHKMYICEITDVLRLS